ncbi:MAG: SMR family transporter [Sulfurimicrobium sp.]
MLPRKDGRGRVVATETLIVTPPAQLLLKAGANAIGHFEFSRDNILPVGWQLATEPHIFGGLSFYVVSVVVWIMALSRVEVSIAYPMLSIGYVVNALAAWWLFGEALSPTRLAGIGIIIIGVYVVARS